MAPPASCRHKCRSERGGGVDSPPSARKPPASSHRSNDTRAPRSHRRRHRHLQPLDLRRLRGYSCVEVRDAPVLRVNQRLERVKLRPQFHRVELVAFEGECRIKKPYWLLVAEGVWHQTPALCFQKLPLCVLTYMLCVPTKGPRHPTYAPCHLTKRAKLRKTPQKSPHIKPMSGDTAPKSPHTAPQSPTPAAM